MTGRRSPEPRRRAPDAVNETHDPALRSWVPSAHSQGTHFPIQNLPFGIFRRRGTTETPRVGVALGDQVVDLARAVRLGLLDALPGVTRAAVRTSSLRALMALSDSQKARLRRHLIRMLSADLSRPEPRILVPMKKAEMMLPVDIGDYTDFYASIFHAVNVGSLFRPDNPLLPNYRHLPIGYHGRSSSIVISGTPIVRPHGQITGAAEQPVFGPTGKLDYEAEIGFLVGTGNALGHPVAIAQAEHHVFGLCLVNDWSARDVQSWEYQPLGPFLAKSFATTMSPWIVTVEALAPFRRPAFARPPGHPSPLPYLSSAADQASGGFEVTVDVFLRSTRMRQAGLDAVRLSRGSLRDMYWTMAQMVTHQTCNGCNLRPGDLLASGTVSGPDSGTEGCLLELTRGGTRPIPLPSGEQRTFLVDGDEVIMRAFCERQGYATVGFGECTGTIRAARP